MGKDEDTNMDVCDGIKNSGRIVNCNYDVTAVANAVWNSNERNKKKRKFTNSDNDDSATDKNGNANDLQESPSSLVTVVETLKSLMIKLQRNHDDVINKMKLELYKTEKRIVTQYNEEINSLKEHLRQQKVENNVKINRSNRVDNIADSAEAKEDEDNDDDANDSNCDGDCSGNNIGDRESESNNAKNAADNAIDSDDDYEGQGNDAKNTAIKENGDDYMNESRRSDVQSFKDEDIDGNGYRNWNKKYQVLVKYVDTNNGQIPKQSYVNKDEDGFHLGQWVSSQRMAYWHPTGNRIITNQRIIALETIPMWKWGSPLKVKLLNDGASFKDENTKGKAHQKWNSSYQVLLKYIATNNGQIPAEHYSNKDDDRFHLGRWVKTQKRAYWHPTSNYNMTNQRITLLEAIPTWTWGETRKKPTKETTMMINDSNNETNKQIDEQNTKQSQYQEKEQNHKIKKYTDTAWI